MERAELISLLRATGCAEERGEVIFLCDPKWSAKQRALAEEQMSKPETRNSKLTSGWLCIPTGGSSGGMKFARHDECTLAAAVCGFCDHFDLGRVNAVDVLPAHHVSGLMARVRCAATGGQHVMWDWKRLEAGDAPSLKVRSARPSTEGDWVISLVPTQLQRLLARPEMVAWLRCFDIIFIGGGPVWPELTETAGREELRLSLSYGMTETAAMVAALRPDEFLAGGRSCGEALPHVKATADSDGVLRISGDSVFRGYWAEWNEGREFATQDLGRIDEHGHLHVLGRRDTVIITGGEKVRPEEVEAALRASGEFSDVAIIGVPDAEWGEAVVACYPADGRAPNVAKASAALAGAARPKRFVPVAPWPRNAQGKINRAALLAALSN